MMMDDSALVIIVILLVSTITMAAAVAKLPITAGNEMATVTKMTMTAITSDNLWGCNERL